MTAPLSSPRTPPGNTVDSFLVSWRDKLCDINIAGFVRVLELYFVGDEQRLLVLRDESPTVYRLTLRRAVIRTPPIPLEALSYIGRTPAGGAVFLYPVERAADIDAGKVKAPGR